MQLLIPWLISLERKRSALARRAKGVRMAPGGSSPGAARVWFTTAATRQGASPKRVCRGSASSYKAGKALKASRITLCIITEAGPWRKCS